MKAMKALFSSVLVALLVGSTMGLTYTGAQATTTTSTEVVSEAPITAPSVALTEPITEITTIPAPIPTPTPTEAPTEALIVAPTVALVEPTEAPTEPAPAPTEETYPAPPVEPNTAGPVCMEDDPCWDCTTMGNKICGNPVCIAQGLVTAADQTCIDYWEPSAGVRMVYFQGDGIEASQIYSRTLGAGLSFDEQQSTFGDFYLGVYKAGYAPAGSLTFASSDPANVYAFRQ